MKVSNIQPIGWAWPQNSLLKGTAHVIHFERTWLTTAHTPVRDWRGPKKEARLGIHTSFPSQHCQAMSVWAAIVTTTLWSWGSEKRGIWAPTLLSASITAELPSLIGSRAFVFTTSSTNWMPWYQQLLLYRPWVCYKFQKLPKMNVEASAFSTVCRSGREKCDRGREREPKTLRGQGKEKTW